LPQSDVFVGESPAQVHFGEGDSALTAESAEVREDFLDQDLAFFVEVEEGAGDEDAEFRALGHWRPVNG